MGVRKIKTIDIRCSDDNFKTVKNFEGAFDYILITVGRAYLISYADGTGHLYTIQLAEIKSYNTIFSLPN